MRVVHRVIVRMMSRRRSSRRSSGRSSRGPARRQGWSGPALLLTGLVAGALAAFVGGYHVGGLGLQAGRGAAQATDPSDPAARATALELLEQAYSARFNQQPLEALALVRRAREADPMVPGADLVAAEIAFDTRQFADLREYALRAVRLRQYAGQANALLGLEKWLTRSAHSFGASASFEDAAGLFATAAADSHFDPLIRFFHGDVLRESGQHDEGKRQAQESLHRLHPWDSASILSLKSALATEEANTPPGAGDSLAVNAGARDAALAIQRATARGDSRAATEEAGRLRSFVTTRQADFLLSDPALGAVSGSPQPISSP